MNENVIENNFQNDSQYYKYVKLAIILSLITVFYNFFEGIISIYFGLEDETLALLGFGLDSFVEVISGIGVLHLVLRMKFGSEPKERDKFERLALRITGFSFYLLTIGLFAGAIINLITGSKPDTTIVGVIISVISLITMYLLVKYKLKTGKILKSDAIIADAMCTKTCFNLSIILLSSSLLYELVKIGYIDIAGSLGIAYFAFKEGKEAFTKAKSVKLSCNC